MTQTKKRSNPFRWLLFIFYLALFLSCSGNVEIEPIFNDPIIDSEAEYIVLFGDVQEYTVNHISLLPFERSVRWIEHQQISYGNMACVLQNGDVTWGNLPDQWKLYQDNIIELSKNGIPTFTCIGNHDYTWTNRIINDRASSLINKSLSDTFPEEYVKSRFEEGKVDNIIVHLPLKTADIDLIILEFGPRKEAVKWANDWVKEHPKQSCILMTHEFLKADGSVHRTSTYAESHFSGTKLTTSTPLDLIENLLRPNPNIKAVICGHNGFARVNTNEAPCPVLLFNLQYQPNGGDSMLLLMKVDPLNKTINCMVYHTDKRIPVSSDLTDFSFSYSND